MSTLTNFFKESTSSLGVFYPNHYIVATFPTLAKAEEAAQALRCSGFSEEEVLALSGGEILEYFEEFRADSGIWAGAMTVFSRGLGTEQVFVDGDKDEARAGAGFLAVHSPEEETMTRIKALVTPFDPKVMHWYRSGGVQSVI